MKTSILILLLLPMICLGQLRYTLNEIGPSHITTDGNEPAIRIKAVNQVQPIIYAWDGNTNVLFQISSKGSITTYGNLTLNGTTNFIVFGATNTPPNITNYPVMWVSVQVSGQTNTYRMPLYN